MEEWKQCWRWLWLLASVIPTRGCERGRSGCWPQTQLVPERGGSGPAACCYHHSQHCHPASPEAAAPPSRWHTHTLPQTVTLTSPYSCTGGEGRRRVQRRAQPLSRSHEASWPDADTHTHGGTHQGALVCLTHSLLEWKRRVDEGEMNQTDMKDEAELKSDWRSKSVKQISLKL